ncbi:MAG: hypothetical protein Q8942_15875, partial [Bacillota bacterium]|nr:hypothetical protein [Bacillota bacterium]
FNNTINGRINYKNDIDCFKFTTNESGNYSITIRADDFSTSYFLYEILYNIKMMRYGGPVSGGNYSMDLTLSPNTSYYINLSNSQLLSNNNYSLMIKENK